MLTSILQSYEQLDEDAVNETQVTSNSNSQDGAETRLGLSYTINLNLPATSDIAVFDAIFKSLKENVLK